MSEAPRKKVLLSGIQPSGNLMIGNYIGALKNWVKLQDQYDCFFILVDLHAITVQQDPIELRKRCYDFLALYIACGIDPNKNTIFVQSHVPAHAELTWVLNCYTMMGDLSRMTQFKDKAKKHAKNINSGLFTYPVLMAADILLYQTDLVPVGEDQKQHLELTRDVAQRFNSIYGETFRIPEPFIGEKQQGARIMSLQDPQSKMSKSDENPRNYIALLDPPDLIRSKIKKAVTDSGTEITYEESRPAIANLMTIHRAISNEPFESLTERFAGKGYAPFKAELADMVVEFLKPIQARFKEIRSDKSELESILKAGAEIANARTQRLMRKVYKKLGFIPAG
ncbi:tryptophan--tRNA ligase [candidate division KSB1 bacterium]|nr:tryptophan--tRNA ligase [candidate division KSB1 bacterium]